jgi:hypothetical protein
MKVSLVCGPPCESRSCDVTWYACCSDDTMWALCVRTSGLASFVSEAGRENMDLKLENVCVVVWADRNNRLDALILCLC